MSESRKNTIAVLEAKTQSSGAQVITLSESLASTTTQKLMKDLFSENSINEEKALIKNNFPDQWEHVSESYNDLEDKINLAKSQLANISISNFKRFLLSQGGSEQQVTLVEILSQTTESTPKNTLK